MGPAIWLLFCTVLCNFNGLGTSGEEVIRKKTPKTNLQCGNVKQDGPVDKNVAHVCFPKYVEGVGSMYLCTKSLPSMQLASATKLRGFIKATNPILQLNEQVLYSYNILAQSIDDYYGNFNTFQFPDRSQIPMVLHMKSLLRRDIETEFKNIEKAFRQLDRKIYWFNDKVNKRSWFLRKTIPIRVRCGPPANNSTKN